MSGIERIGWDNLRHGGLLLDSPRLRRIAEYEPDPLTSWQERELRRQAGLFLADAADMPAFVRFVLEEICGFTAANGHWQRGPQLGAEWGRRAVTGETAKPRYMAIRKRCDTPCFLEEEPRLPGSAAAAGPEPGRSVAARWTGTSRRPHQRPSVASRFCRY